MTTYATLDPATATFALHPTEAAATTAADAADLMLVLSLDNMPEMTGPVAVALFAATAAPLGIAPVKRFPDRATAARRIWANLVALSAAAAVAEVAPAPEPQPAVQAARPVQRRSRGIHIAPKDAAKACRWGSKQAILVDLLSRSGGASMSELREVLGNWSDVTIKSGLSWDMASVKGYGIKTTHEDGYQRFLATDYSGMGTFRADSHPDDLSEAEKAALLAKNLAEGYNPNELFAVYHLVLPAGMTAPVPHTGGPTITTADKLNNRDPLPGEVAQ